MTPRDERNYWHASSMLKIAEALTGMPEVSGADDEPPRAGEEQSWVQRWSERASAALDKAKAWALSKKKAMVDRASRVASAIRNGARRLYQTKPIQLLQDVIHTADKVQAAGEGLALALTIGLAYVAYRVFIKKS